jgi:hypothetical protein
MGNARFISLLETTRLVESELKLCARGSRETRSLKKPVGVEDRGDTHSEILNELTENITRKEDGRYEVSFPWISGKRPSDTNEQQS